MYALRAGFLFRCVCLMASHTVRNPKPIVKPAASEATWKSVFDAIVRACGCGWKSRLLRKFPGFPWLGACVLSLAGLFWRTVLGARRLRIGRRQQIDIRAYTLHLRGFPLPHCERTPWRRCGSAFGQSKRCGGLATTRAKIDTYRKCSDGGLALGK